MTLLESALEYAARGIPVFILHDVTTGVCSCGDLQCGSPGKHPRTQHGFLDATTDPELIRSWFERYPKSNLGMPTGKRSGWAVIDKDDGELPEPVDGVPQSSTHGDRGHYLIEAGDLKNATNVVPGVDVRGEGGYIVLPPSLHHSGETYSWLVTIEEGERKPAPAWLLEAMAKKPEPASAPESQGDLTEYLRAMSAIAAISPDTRPTWQRVGTAVKDLLGDSGFWIWDAWSRGTTKGKYTASTQRAQWKSFRADDGTANSIGPESLWWLATRAGWVESGVGEPAPLPAPIAEALPFPTSAIDDMPPLMRLAYDWILARSIRPQPILAFAGTLALFSTLTARRYGLPGVRTNLYIMAIAPTGTGKAAPRSAVKALLFKAKLNGLLGGEGIASDAGVTGALTRSAVSLFQIDEISEVFQRWTSFNAKPHERAIMTRILDLFSANGDTILGSEYSQSSKDSKERIDLDDPCMVIHGTTTPGIWDVMDDQAAARGLLSRLLVFECPPNLVEMNAVDPGANEPPHELVMGVQELQGQGGNLEMALNEARTQMVEVSDEYEKAYRTLDTEVIAWGTKIGPSSGAWQAGSRMVELAQRMALIHAVVSDPACPVLRADALSWGASLARYSSSLVAKRLETSISSSQTGKKSNQMLAFIGGKNPEKVTKSEIARAFRGIPKRERTDLLDDLIASGQVVKAEKTGKGRTATLYSLPSGKEGRAGNLVSQDIPSG